MYRFDPTVSSVVEEEAAPPRPALSAEEPAEGPLSAEQLAGIQAYWQAANYLTVGQIYLQDNPLLREPLRPEHSNPRLLGHWGTSPGLSLTYVHLRVRGGDRKGHRLLEGALRGPARDKQLDLDTMNLPTEILMMGLLKDQDREGSRGTNNGA